MGGGRVKLPRKRRESFHGGSNLVVEWWQARFNKDEGFGYVGGENGSVHEFMMNLMDGGKGNGGHGYDGMKGEEEGIKAKRI
ncbi:hypothetical protein VNO77_15246 [Canavalia gladiata]|uniref:Uncharacterized protein n=1 Tax=Canavalia gladiata TaxID=3824 RepID=A0AAN9M3T4_CANGL